MNRDIHDESQRAPARARRIIRQRLESLQRAGVEQLGRVPNTNLVSPPMEPPAPNQPPPEPPEPKPPTLEQPTDRASELPADSTTDLPVLTLPQRQSELSKLCEQVTACELCPELVQNRTQTVFGVGNPEARLCFFGEAPGADEDQQGEPFVGRAGQLLNKIIEACTLTRDDVYILNVLKCRPPGNRNPNPEEAQHCRPFFERQLEIIQPEFICCLGSVAATTLLETNAPIGKLRGRLHSWRDARVLATYHPAYLLRNPAAKRDVWNDMQLLMREMGIQVPKAKS